MNFIIFTKRCFFNCKNHEKYEKSSKNHVFYDFLHFFSMFRCVWKRHISHESTYTDRENDGFHYKKIKRTKNDPDLIAKPKGGFYKSGQLLTVILITKILDWPSFFFFSNTIFSPTLDEESQKVSFLIKHGHPPNSPTFLFWFIY